MRSHRGFCLDLITGIYHRIGIWWQQLQPVIGIDKIINALHLAMRVDLRDALTHGFDLGLANRVSQRMDLAVDVGLSHMIHIDQG